MHLKPVAPTSDRNSCCTESAQLCCLLTSIPCTRAPPLIPSPSSLMPYLSRLSPPTCRTRQLCLCVNLPGFCWPLSPPPPPPPTPPSPAPLPHPCPKPFFLLTMGTQSFTLSQPVSMLPNFCKPLHPFSVLAQPSNPPQPS